MYISIRHGFQRALLTCVVLSATSALFAQQTPYILSERLGDTINTEEQAYFGLFPDVPNFVSAAVFEGPGSKIQIRITTKASPVVKSIDRTVAVELAKYLAAFERYALENDYQSLNWLLIRNLVTPVKPYKRGKLVEVILHDGTSLHGQLLYATEQHVLLTQAPDLFSYADSSYILSAALRDVENISFKRQRVKGKNLLRLLFPPIPQSTPRAPTEASPAKKGTLILADLEGKMALEPSRLPPEIRHVLMELELEQNNASAPLSQPPSKANSVSYVELLDRFHLFVAGVPLSVHSSSSTTIIFTSEPGVLEPSTSRSASFLSPKLYVEFEYTLKEHVRIGINFQQHRGIPALTVDEDGAFTEDPIAEYLSGSSVGVFGTFIRNPIHKNTRAKAPLPELSLRLGLVYASLETTGRIAILSTVGESTRPNTTLGALVQVGVDIYLSRRLSLSTMVQARAYPNTRVKQQATSRYSQYTSYSYAYAQERRYTPFQVNLLTGIRVHL